MTRRDTTNSLLTRRAALGAGSATLAAMVLGPATVSAANENVETWALDPTGGRSACTSNCATCNACQHHRANKLFKTQAVAAAVGSRAHPGCRCTVITGQPLSAAVFAQMFSGVVPITILAAGAAGIGWLARRREGPSG